MKYGFVAVFAFTAILAASCSGGGGGGGQSSPPPAAAPAAAAASPTPTPAPATGANACENATPAPNTGTSVECYDIQDSYPAPCDTGRHLFSGTDKRAIIYQECQALESVSQNSPAGGDCAADARNKLYNDLGCYTLLGVFSETP